MRREERPYFVFVSEPDGKEFRREEECLKHEAELRHQEDPVYIDTMIRTIRNILRDKKRYALPKKFEQYVAMKTGFTRTLRMSRKTKRSVEWLRSLGMCAARLVDARKSYEREIADFKQERDELIRLINKRTVILRPVRDAAAENP